MATNNKTQHALKVIGFRVAHSKESDDMNNQIENAFIDGFIPFGQYGIYFVGGEQQFAQVFTKQIKDLSVNAGQDILPEKIMAMKLISEKNYDEFNIKVAKAFADNFYPIEPPRIMLNEKEKYLFFVVMFIKHEQILELIN